MLRQVMVPSKENSTVSIPSEFYGKEVEILVFPLKPQDRRAALVEQNLLFAYPQKAPVCKFVEKLWKTHFPKEGERPLYKRAKMPLKFFPCVLCISAHPV